MYTSPITYNNILVAQYDIAKLAEEVKDITGNMAAYDPFIRNFAKFIKNPSGLISLLMSQETPNGFLQKIALETNDFISYKSIATVGKYLSNEMTDVRKGFTPMPSVVTPQVYTSGLNAIINIWDNDTIERRQRNENRITLVNTFRLVGLVGMFEQSAIDNYTTTNDLEARRRVLDTYYQTLVEDDVSNYVIQDVKTILDSLKVVTEQALQSKEQSGSVFKTTTIKLERPYSARQISYDLYGEFIQNEQQLSTFTDIISRLNRSQPAHALTGIINILEIR